MAEIDWRPEPEFWSANNAEHAFVGDHELVAFDIPASDEFERRIGWEVFTGAPKYLDLVAKGDAADFDTAKRDAETYLATMGGSGTRH